MSRHLVYTPTGERVEMLRVTNEGQTKPGDPGRGIRLYAVRTTKPGLGGQPNTIQAAAHELATVEDGKKRAFREEEWIDPPGVHRLRAEDVTIQSIRSLEAWIETRGAEELRDFIGWITEGLRYNHDLTLKVGDDQ